MEIEFIQHCENDNLKGVNDCLSHGVDVNTKEDWGGWTETGEWRKDSRDLQLDWHFRMDQGVCVFNICNILIDIVLTGSLRTQARRKQMIAARWRRMLGNLSTQNWLKR